MPRRHPATALLVLALATFVGTGGSAEAEATPRVTSTIAEPTLEALDREPTPAGDQGQRAATASVEATLVGSAGGAFAGSGTPWATDDEDTGTEPWTARIEDRLTALREAAGAHAARRPDRASASAALLERLSALAAGLHGAADLEVGLGIAVRDLDTGAPVFEHEAERRLNPASNHKLLTAVAALELLGDDYRFETRVLRAGDALVLRGEGDPSLRTEDLERLAAEVAAAIDLGEIRRVIVDDTAFTARRFGPGYHAGGPGPSYMAPSGALSVQWNTVEVRVRGAGSGHALPVEISPASEHVEIRSTATGGRGSVRVQSWVEGDRTVITVDGKLRAGARYTKRRRVGDPGRFAGSAFAAMLARRGAAGPDGSPLPVELGPTPAEATPVATHTSAPLPQVLDSALSWSNNFASEQILRTLGWRMSGEPGDWDNGRRALERYWQAAGLSHHALEFENASGLSSSTRISAAALADLLAFAAREGSPSAALWSALPVAGREGTLRGRLRRSGGRVRAKTGTLHDASALSGMVRARGGRRLGFSILVNGPVSPDRSRRLQDAVVMALVNYGAPR